MVKRSSVYLTLFRHGWPLEYFRYFLLWFKSRFSPKAIIYASITTVMTQYKQFLLYLLKNRTTGKPLSSWNINFHKIKRSFKSVFGQGTGERFSYFYVTSLHSTGREQTNGWLLFLFTNKFSQAAFIVQKWFLFQLYERDFFYNVKMKTIRPATFCLEYKYLYTYKKSYLILHTFCVII